MRAPSVLHGFRGAPRAIFASLAILTGAAPALAQSQSAPAARSADARSHFEHGLTFYAEGDYAAALVDFQRAYDQSPNWRVLFNIGQSYFQLRDYASALTTLQRFATEGGSLIGPEDRATLDTELPDLANRVAKVTIECNLDFATISVDDRAVGTTPLQGPLLVSAGLRKITASYEGRAPVQEQVAVSGGDAISVRLVLVTPPPVAEAAVVSPPPTDVTETPASQRVNYVPAYVSFLVGASGLAAGSIFGLVAIDQKSELDRICNASKGCPPSSQSDIHSLTRDGTISTVGFGLGIAGIAGGLVLYAIARSPSAVKADSIRGVRSADLKVSLGPGFVTGRF